MACINFTHVVGRDCFGYVLLDFWFTEGINSIEGGNGASKTSIFLTLMQGLFNRNAKGTKIDEVNNTITGLPYEIEVYFEDSNRASYVVINSRKTGTIEIYKNGKPKHVKRIPDNLKIIEDILGVDYSTFQDLIYQSPKSSINLLEKDSDTSRKAFINKILKLDELDSQLEVMKQRDKEIVGKGGKLEILKSQLLVLESSIDESYSDVAEEVDLNPFTTLMESLNERRDAHKEELVALNATLSGIKKEQKVYENNKTQLDKIADLDTAIRSMGHPIHTLEYLLELRTDLLEEQRQAQDVVQQSQLILDKDAVNEERKELRKALQRQIKELNLVTTKEQTETTIECIQNDINITQAKYISTKNELTKLKECVTLKQCPTCNSIVDTATLEYNLSRTIQVKSNIYEELERLKGSLTVELAFKALHKTREELLRKIAALEIYSETFDLVSTFADRQRAESIIENCNLSLEECSKDILYVKKYNALQRDLEDLKRVTPTNISCASFDHDILATNTYIDREQVQLDNIEASISEVSLQLREAETFNSTQRTLAAVNNQRRTQNELICSKVICLKKEIEDLEARSDLLKIWIGILGPKGFRVHKMNSFLQHLNTTMQKYSDMICGGRIKCMFFMNEGEIDFTVIDCNKTVSWACWSEGERARVKLPCLFAVLELLEILGSVSFNVLALDEIFSALDISGKEGLFNVLNYLKNKGRAIYTIAHTKLALDTEFSSVIKAYKMDDGTTTVVQ